MRSRSRLFVLGTKLSRYLIAMALSYTRANRCRRNDGYDSIWSRLLDAHYLRRRSVFELIRIVDAVTRAREVDVRDGVFAARRIQALIDSNRGRVELQLISQGQIAESDM